MATSDFHSPAQIPLAGRVISTILSMATIAVLVIAFSEFFIVLILYLEYELIAA